MNDHPTTLQIALEPQDNERLSNLCGPLEEHLHQIERQLGIEINNRGHAFSLVGPDTAVSAAEELITELYRDTASETLDAERIHLALQQAGIEELLAKAPAHEPQDVVVKTRRGMVR